MSLVFVLVLRGLFLGLSPLDVLLFGLFVGVVFLSFIGFAIVLEVTCFIYLVGLDSLR